ncbi:KGK domain-containing protein [Pannus brasiliensis CCIBt3594]|uniref:KGK domain-containing protein n=1 Tax=Pannus brasiliensis CCIBt3594 TaxID=1427578 RepID=A0AAW9QZE4_9CHRO
MIIKDSQDTQGLIIEDENSVLMFEDEQTILVKKFKQKLLSDLTYHINKKACYGLIESSSGTRLGQINNFDWIFYPSEGKECQLLLLGDTSWRSGYLKIYGKCVFTDLKNEDFNDPQKTRQINIILEFISKDVTIDEPQEPESPLDDIRRSMM